MVDTADLKSAVRKDLRVRVPSPVRSWISQVQLIKTKGKGLDGIMPTKHRAPKVREELKRTGKLVDENGTEIARMTELGYLTLNETELWLAIIRGANRHRGWCPATRLNIAFGLTGSWRPDYAVKTTLIRFEEVGLVKLEWDLDKITGVAPIVMAEEGLKAVKPYRTTHEILAGLYAIGESEML